MGDTKDGREKQADTKRRRQQDRDAATEIERGDEPEPPVDQSAFEPFGPDLDALTYPASAPTVVAAVGGYELETKAHEYTVAELLPETAIETFDSPEAVQKRLRRPEVAAAMKRVVEAAATLQNPEFGSSQQEAYEKTLRALQAVGVDADGLNEMADWISERIHEHETLPNSRAVRRAAAKFCRQNGYEVRNDEWLGI